MPSEKQVKIEAIARTGAVKVKALEEDDYEEITNAAGIAMRRASRGIRGQVITVQDSFDWWVMKETERRILSALEPHPRDTNTVASHETANVSDKPEGQQEPVAAWQRRVLYPENGAKPQWKQCSATEATDQFARSPYHEYRPLFTRPSEQAVTEASVRAALKSLHENPLSWEHPDAIRAALKAAMEAGG